MKSTPMKRMGFELLALVIFSPMGASIPQLSASVKSKDTNCLHLYMPSFAPSPLPGI